MRIATNMMVFLLILLMLPIIIQVIICKNTKGRWGLVLPILSLIVINQGAFGWISFDSIGNNQPTTINLIIGLVIANIPSMILYLIYVYYKKKQNKQDELDKMEIMDM